MGFCFFVVVVFFLKESPSRRQCTQTSRVEKAGPSTEGAGIVKVRSSLLSQDFFFFLNQRSGNVNFIAFRRRTTGRRQRLVFKGNWQEIQADVV